ncbi:MAG TPA: lytic transglycosylase domain-containing protein [Methylocystis sp.]|nr:lytic transglycosylase domain-containing protein [Methylocystis sp.]
MKETRVKAAIAAVFAAALVLSGCSGHDPRDFLAQAPDSVVQAARAKNREAICARITHHAKLNEIPESLIHRVVQRESKYDPSLRHGRYWGLMQISHSTAKSMGYSGPPIGLLDPETNLTYAVAYLANAYRVAGGDEKQAQKLYMRGYYCEAKRRGRLSLLHPAPAEAQYSTRAEADAPAEAQSAETAANDTQGAAEAAALDQAALEHNPANTENHLDSQYLERVSEEKPAPLPPVRPRKAAFLKAGVTTH